jgi:hypothetical protein
MDKPLTRQTGSNTGKVTEHDLFSRWPLALAVRTMPDDLPWLAIQRDQSLLRATPRHEMLNARGVDLITPHMHVRTDIIALTHRLGHGRKPGERIRLGRGRIGHGSGGNHMQILDLKNVRTLRTCSLTARTRCDQQSEHHTTSKIPSRHQLLRVKVDHAQ